MQDATAEPLIWTTKGNLLVPSLAYRHGWQDGEDATMPANYATNALLRIA